MPANRFHTFMDAWVLHRVWGLPLRMIFLCSWHRVHFAAIALGVAVVAAGKLTGVPWLGFVGVCVAAPSVVCLLLFPVLAILFLALEKLLAERPGR
jgi:hypothetical protein